MNLSFDTLSSLLDVSFDKALAYKKQIGLGLAAAAAIALGATAFHWYWTWAQEAAQKTFFEVQRYYEAPVGTRKTSVINNETVEYASAQDKWATVASQYERAYNEHKRAGIGPMFRVYQAEALAVQGKHDEAISMLEGVTRDIASREVQDFVKLNLALMKLDSKEQAMQKEGLNALKAIAEDSNGSAHEAGLYYLGYFHFMQNDLAQAKNYWQQLMVKYGMKDDRNQSGLAELTRGKLKLISADW
ncbi:hypothetical protein EBZ39_10715 [bacterium]|nr:hypothetical protein [bacterium]